MNPVARMAPLSGLVFVVLFGIGNGIWAFDQPSRGADTSEILAFFDATSTRILVGGTLSLVSIASLVWFGAFVRERLAAAEGTARSGLSLVAFAGTLLIAALGLAAETINMAGALSAEDGQLTGEAAQLFFDLSYAFGAHAAGIAFALFAVPVGVTALRTGQVMSRPAAWLVVLLGIALMTPALLFRPTFLILYALVLLTFAALSLHLYRSPEA